MSEQSSAYSPESITEYFDEFAVGEWERLVATPVDRVRLYLHTHFLQAFLHSGNKVLEIRAGDGGFTQVLAQTNTVTF